MPTPEVRVLTQVDKRFTPGRWARGQRTRDGLDFCLVAAVDDAAAHFPPQVRDRVFQELVEELPPTLRRIGRRAPRPTLAFYNDYVGRRRGVLRMVKTTLARLATSQAFTAQMAVVHAPSVVTADDEFAPIDLRSDEAVEEPGFRPGTSPQA
jgi:hypothetical protein